jgi:predicted O-methyltransferase YrrM
MLDDIVETSESNEIVKFISNNMDGNTFHHHYHILYDIRTYLGEEKKIYTEIGTFCGGSLSLILQHLYVTDIVAIDPLHVLNNQSQIVENNIKKFNLHNRNITLHKKFSNDNNFIMELKENSFNTDILFIDGDHSYNGVINDFNNYEQFVNKNGFIVFDDYLDYKYSPEVKYAVDDIVKNLDKSKFNIIGSIKNIKDAFTNSDEKMDYLNEFIIQKIN